MAGWHSSSLCLISIAEDHKEVPLATVCEDWDQHYLLFPSTASSSRALLALNCWTVTISRGDWGKGHRPAAAAI